MENPDKRKTTKTKNQEREQRLFSNLNIEWGKLSYEQKLKWYELAKEDSIKRSGSGKKLKDGQLIFLSYNGFLQEIGEPINKDAPVLEDPQYFTYVSLDIANKGGKGEMILHFKPAIDSSTKLIIYSTAGLNTGKPEIDKRYFRKICVLDSNFISGSNILAQYLCIFKEIPSKGKVVGLKVLPVNKRCGKIGLAYSIPFEVK